MKFLKFIKYYLQMKKVINELEYRKAVVEMNIKKLDDKTKKFHNTISSYHRKKLEFYKGKYEGYENSILTINKFLDTGILLNINEDDNEL